jgi:hypothetical protein
MPGATLQNRDDLAIPNSASGSGRRVRGTDAKGRLRRINGGRAVSAPHPIAPVLGHGGRAWRHHVANRCRYGIGTRLIDVFKGVERRVRQGRFGSGNSAKLYHTFFIRDRGHRIDYFLRRILSQ